MGGVGAWLLYRRGMRAEVLAIVGICVLYFGYNAGYYLPFGGGFMGPRFLMTMMPFLALPTALALKRFPGPTIALAAVSLTTMVIATITHPLIGYENEAVVFVRYLGKGYFQPTIASAFGMGRGWGGSGRSCWPPPARWCVRSWPRPARASPRGRCCGVSRRSPAGASSPRSRRHFWDRPSRAALNRRRGRQHGPEPDPAQRHPLPPTRPRPTAAGVGLLALLLAKLLGDMWPPARGDQRRRQRAPEPVPREAI